jgi:hypothetical protein
MRAARRGGDVAGEKDGDRNVRVVPSLGKLRRVDGVDRNDAVGRLAERERSKKKRAHQAEDDGVGGDAEPEREKGRRQ